MITTLLFYTQALKQKRSALQSEIDTLASRIVSDVHLQSQLYVKLLLREVPFFNMPRQLSAQRWHEHISEIKLQKQYKDVQNIGFSQMTEGENPSYAISFLESFSPAESLTLGYDMYKSPLFHDAIQKALESSEAVLSQSIFPSTDQQSIVTNYVLLLPLYHNNIIPETPEERTALQRGFIFLTFNLASYLEEIINKSLPDAKVSIYDTTEIPAARLIYRKIPDTYDDSTSMNLSKHLTLTLEGRSWEFYFSSKPLPASQMQTSTLLLAMGIAVSLLLFLLFLSISRSISKAKVLARAKTEKIRRLNQDLLNSSQQYSLTFKQANIGIANVTIDSTMIEVNMHLCEMLGYSYEELKSIKLKDLIFASDWSRTLLLLEQLLENSEETSRIENRLIRKTGDHIWCDLSISLIRGNLNKTLYFIYTIQDISSHKQLIRDLNDQKEEFERIIQISPSPIMLHAEDGEIIMINQAWQELSGYSHEDIPTIEQWTLKAYGTAQSTLKEHINTLYETKKRIETGEFEVTAKSGEKLYWRFSAAPMWKIEDGRRMLISTAMDLTALKSQEDMLIHQSRQAAMGEMISMIAHQWRQPLTSIGMLVNNLLLSLDLDAEITDDYLREMSSDILGLVEHLSAVVDDFRNFFQPIKEKEHATIEKIFNNVSKIIVKDLEDCNIDVVFNNHSQSELYTYPNALLQILVNLIQNSKNAIIKQGRGGGAITITVSEAEDLIKITVCDTGGGIKEEHKKQIGQPYFSTKSKNGTGLGLYMSKTIMEKHLKGSLTWENNREGVCFTLHFPRSLDRCEDKRDTH